jgi:LuxR family transcriptional regulator, maltose regulon positive regulatory protein
MVSSPEPTVARIPLLATKHFAPTWRPGLVARPRLIARLDQGAERALTLVSAPAGFGKTTLLAEWLTAITRNRRSAGERTTAWLSLDPGDNDSARFWAYVITALQTVRPGIGATALALLQSPQPPPIEAIVTTLINELAALEDHIVLVLDDLHVIDVQPILDAIAFFLDRLPPRLHLVVATREDPSLPLPRLRARGQLTELRAADLRFTPDEAAAFLNEAMGLDLSATDIAALESRTEGWIAGLQLAALSMQDHQDIPGFIRAFAGDHRYVVDYLVEEVLQRQPEAVRSFLLQTSILDRLTGALCDAVTGQDDGHARLAALERGNFFVVPLDDTRHWYRYHHLFADVLHMRLLAEHLDQVATLHRNASAWHEHHGSMADAIRHALAGGDAARAADLVERAAPAMRRSRQEATLLGWFRALPDELVRCRPVLNVAYASALMSTGDFEGVEDRLRDAERWLAPTATGAEQPATPSAEMVVVDPEEFGRLPGVIAISRAGHALALGDLATTVTFAQRALTLLDEDDLIWRGAASAILGLASWASGDLAAAHRSYAEGMASLQRAGNIADAIAGAITLADLRIAQGRLREARRTYERGLRLGTAPGGPVLRGTADMHVGLSALDRERNDLEAATQHLLTSQDLGEHLGFPQYPYRWCVAMARIREVQGDLDGALDLLDEAERRYAGDFSPNVRPIAALKTRVWLAQGRLGDALGWVRERGLSPEDDLCYLREFEHVTLARVLLARFVSDRADRSLREVMGLLERLRQAADAGERMGSVLEILILQALAHHLRGDVPAALAPLERALTLAEPEGYLRTFVDEGPSMTVLLEAAAKRGIVPTYVRQLLPAFGTAEHRRPVRQDLSEPLSERELDVLRLLGTDLGGPDIARELMVSLNTMRTHTKNIYAKLGVTSRRAAVRRAEDRGLLSRTHAHPRTGTVQEG